MSARKLSRLAGLVFVLAAILGGVGVGAASAEHETGGSAATTTADAQTNLIDINWG